MNWDHSLDAFAKVKEDPKQIAFVSERLRDDLDFMSALAALNIHHLKYASQRLRSDVCFMYACFHMKPTHALKYASHTIANDPKFIINCWRICSTTEHWQYVGQSLKKNVNFVLACLKAYYDRDWGEYELSAFDQAIIQDAYSIAQTSLIHKHNYHSYYYIHSDHYTHDRCHKIKDESILLYVSDQLKDNFLVVNTAIKKEPKALKYASARLQKKFHYYSKRVSEHGQSLREVDYKKHIHFQKNRFSDDEVSSFYELLKSNIKDQNKGLSQEMMPYEVIQKLHSTHLALFTIPMHLHDNEDILTITKAKVLRFMADVHNHYQYLYRQPYWHEDFIQEKIHREITVYLFFNFLPVCLQNDRDVIKQAFLDRDYGSSLRYAVSLKDDAQFINEIQDLQYASFRLKNNPDFILDLIVQSPKNMRFISAQLKQNFDFLKRAIEKNIDVYSYLDRDVKETCKAFYQQMYELNLPQRKK